MRLFDKDNHFNAANLISFGNIATGMIAIYFIIQGNFFVASILAWIAGGLDIADGKVARRYGLSTEFGIQLDSFADFLSFVVMPSFFLFFALRGGSQLNVAGEILIGLIFIFYVICGLRRLIEFNIKVDAGEVARYFEGVPTPLGAILLWILYLLYSYDIISSPYVIIFFVVIVAMALNSRVKIRHP